MGQFLAIAGPIVGTAVLWSLITIIPMPAPILLVLVVISGALLMWGIVYFQKIANKDQ